MREEQLRLSPEVQAAYTAAEVDSSDSDWLLVTEELQRRVVREFGATDENEAATLCALRRAALDNEEFVPLYVRFQRARLGQLRIGNAVADCELMKIDGGVTSLENELRPESTTCVLAGSYS